MQNEQNNTIFTSTFGESNENQVSVKLNRYKKGSWLIASNGHTHEYEILIDCGKGFKTIKTMRATVSQAKKMAEKYMIQEFVYLNPLNK